MEHSPNFKRLVIAAYRLPYKFTKTKSGYRAVQNSGGLVSAILALSESFKINQGQGLSEKILWAGVSDNLPQNTSSKNIYNEHFDIAPITLPAQLDELFYGGFCNDLIWPLFHYFPSYSVFNIDYFKAFEEANARFCAEIVHFYKPGDFIWIHDYHLMLLPEMIRKKIPDAAIGFFLHIPFPSFEIFRLLPRQWRESIVKGLLGADLVGFHTHDYTQNFIKSVKRTTGYECHRNIIYTPNKMVKADAFPIGIDFEKFRSSSLNKKVLAVKQKIKNDISSQKLIFSVDRLDYSKGLLLRLKGYETFLEKYPEWHTKIVFNMVVVPSRNSILKYKKLKKEIEHFVGHIIGKYSTLSWSPIIYQYKSLNFNEMIALYSLSDVGLITPLRDGMNLVAKEYIACQNEKKGALILSEMAGASAELIEALIINPADNIEMADAIQHALNMSPEEKSKRLLRMQLRLRSYDVFAWAGDFFHQAHDTKIQQLKMNVRFIHSATSDQIRTDYRKATKRLFLFDYDGTLVSFTKYPEMATMNKATLDIIKNLTNDSKNKVAIISGRNKEFLEQQFEHIPLNLVAEHGYFTKMKGQNWETAVVAVDHWKESVMNILTEFVNRCSGTFIEEKTASIAWHYRNADADFVQLRLHELRDNLSEIIRHKTDFEILEGNKVLEVKSGKYDKGQAAISMMKDENFDFILAAGDDKTDEIIYQVLPDWAYTIRVGLTPSYARYNVTDYSHLLNLIKSLTA